LLEAHKGLGGTDMTGIFTKNFTFMNAGVQKTYNTGFGLYKGIPLWGNLWKWFSNIEYEIQSEADGGKSFIWVQMNPLKGDKNRSDSSFEFKETYQMMGEAARVSTWSKSTNVNSGQVKTGGAGETTYNCQYFWAGIPATGTDRRGVIVGAYLPYGSTCALGSSNSRYGPSRSSAYLGGGFRASVNKIG